MSKTVVQFPKMGPYERALCYSRFRVLTSGLFSTFFLFDTEDWNAQSKGYLKDPKINKSIIPTGVWFSEETYAGSLPPVPIEVWNGKLEKDGEQID